MAKIAVFGATGTIGSTITREALDRGHEVTAVRRDAAKAADPRAEAAVGDVLDPNSVAAIAKGHDVLISAVGGGDGPGHVATIKPAAESLVAALRTLGEDAPRLIVVGGAGSLRTPNGSEVREKAGLPEFLLQIMNAHADALDFYRGVSDVSWTNLSPAAAIEPGDRTGEYRTGLDDLIVDGNGASRISTEDYAVAVVDEIENPRHVGARFTVGY